MGDEVTVVGPLSRGDAGPGSRGFSGVLNIPANGAANYLAILTPPWSVRRFFRAADFDVVHVHEPLTPLLAYYALWFSPRAAHVCTFHMYAEEEGLGSRMMRGLLASRVFPRFERGIAVSPAAADYAGRVWTRPLTVIPNGVATATFVPPEDQEGAAAPQSPLRLLFVGHWRDPRKGLAHLLEACRILHATGTPVHLDVVGDGTAAATNQRGVTFHGPVTAESVLAERYASCDLFVAPSTGQESFGIVLLEAMACGRPIVCSDIPGYRHVVDRAGARLVSPGDADALAQVIGHLAREPVLRREMGASNRRRAEAYRWDHVASRVRQEYLDAIAEQSRGTLTHARLLRAGSS